MQESVPFENDIAQSFYTHIHTHTYVYDVATEHLNFPHANGHFMKNGVRGKKCSFFSLEITTNNGIRPNMYQKRFISILDFSHTK